MWKKAAVIVMCLAFLLSMTGCGGSGKESKLRRLRQRKQRTEYGSEGSRYAEHGSCKCRCGPYRRGSSCHYKITGG